ncbi:hypothetical protein GO605_17575 [Streptomyces murinus]|nr:hypothetical protein GO605_17575 [Streptomyces murinus]
MQRFLGGGQVRHRLRPQHAPTVGRRGQRRDRAATHDSQVLPGIHTRLNPSPAPGPGQPGLRRPYPTSSPTAAPLIVARFTKSQCQPCRTRDLPGDARVTGHSDDETDHAHTSRTSQPGELVGGLSMTPARP